MLCCFSQVEIYKEYKSGASYKGQVKDNKKTGRGVFTWPNGAKYEGEFINNIRHGDGKCLFKIYKTTYYFYVILCGT